MRRVRKKGLPPCAFAALFVLWVSGAALAENVDPAADGSQYAWGENTGWLNAEPQGDGAMGVQATDTELTGWIWAGDHGWISLSCQNTSSCGVNGYGITNDGKGNLSGFAWGEHLGWINFRTSGGSDCCSASGTPGCTDSVCEAVICPANPSCCNGDWDATCAATATAEPACSPGCASDPFGVRIHGFTGEFSGFAWTEHNGWINFGTAPVAQSHQIETAWRCPDPDADGVCTASDNCPGYANSGQGTVLFGQTLMALDKFLFGWAITADFEAVTGDFISSADIGTYTVVAGVTGTGTDFPGNLPLAGMGSWYLVRPNCPAGSHSTGSASEQGDRDGALLP